MITIGSKKYKVVEDLGFNHDLGKYAKVLDVNGKERVATKSPGGIWEWHKVEVRRRSFVKGQ
ncbi:hypothetical protein LCGC14_0220030 [marine sediment metagenome]|uniref:Uncharacterized protein n=1 Tax=marine sediment metagenome TaxID=412755 RepID=A0A0F9XGU8_9ZZZZ